MTTWGRCILFAIVMIDKDREMLMTVQRWAELSDNMYGFVEMGVT